MVRATHDFWSHVPRGSTSLLCIVRVPDSGNTKICYTKVAFIVKN
jgi:hypothetical protein